MNEWGNEWSLTTFAFGEPPRAVPGAALALPLPVLCAAVHWPQLVWTLSATLTPVPSYLLFSCQSSQSEGRWGTHLKWGVWGPVNSTLKSPQDGSSCHVWQGSCLPLRLLFVPLPPAAEGSCALSFCFIPWPPVAPDSTLFPPCDFLSGQLSVSLQILSQRSLSLKSLVWFLDKLHTSWSSLGTAIMLVIFPIASLPTSLWGSEGGCQVCSAPLSIPSAEWLAHGKGSINHCWMKDWRERRKL